MKVSCNWLGQYLDSLPDIAQLVNLLTFSGIEVEAVHKLEPLSETVVTAKVVSAERVADSDHLTACMVEYGGPEQVQVVCGAPNCHSGMVTVLALPGSNLQGFVIKKARLKGVDSFGMLCSERELGISDNHAGIIELDADTPLGVSVNAIYDLPDTVLELEITPNRSDLLGYLGIARDLSATLNQDVKLPAVDTFAHPHSDGYKLNLQVENAEKCPRYTARIIEGIAVNESPQWLKTALIKSGLRPINNIVDITNYVMLETGHPLHAFDYQKLHTQSSNDAHPTISVRNAKEGEVFLALDGKSYTLDTKDLVIADEAEPAALAGVMGGKPTSITNDTSVIVLEAATFNPQSVRATSYKHKISTDSSYRFERHLSEEAPIYASERATSLICSISGGEAQQTLYDAYPEPVEQMYLAVRPSKFQSLIGYKLDEELIIGYLEALGCVYSQKGACIEGLISNLSVTISTIPEDANTALYFRIPSYRKDLSREADLIEELARIAGYDKIPQKKAVSMIMDRHAHQLMRFVADHLVHEGFYEMLNFSFCDPAHLALIGFKAEEIEQQLISLINPQSSNQSAMRISLLPQLLGNLSYNINRGERNLKIFEMASIYLKNSSSYKETVALTALMTGTNQEENWKNKLEPISIYHPKGIVQKLFNLVGLDVTATYNSEKPWLIGSDSMAFYSGDVLCATIGRVRSEVAEKFEIDIHQLKQDIWMIELELETIVALTRQHNKVFVSLPKYPAVIRDLSFIIANEVSYSQIETAIRALDERIIKQVSLFDEYRGKQVPEGSRSLSMHILLQDEEKTLTDEHVDQLIASVVNYLTDKWQIKMR